eukprot:969442-Prorocentrum_minimum.AAC.1
MDDGQLLKRVKELHDGMSKKKTFEASVTDLTLLVETQLPNASRDLQLALYEAVVRCTTLLKTRYGANTIGALPMACSRLNVFHAF